MSRLEQDIGRRDVLKAGASAGLMLGLAGCLGSSGAVQAPTASEKNKNSETPMTDNDSTTGPLFQTIQLTVLPGGRHGPDGKMHDTFAPGSFTLIQGVPAIIEVYNYDQMLHSLTAPDLDLDIKVLAAAKEGVPNVTTQMFTPKKSGDFSWVCTVPCDEDANGWAMSHDGYMKGSIHVSPNKDVQHLYTTIEGGYKAGPKGNLHDSFLPANFTVTKGVPVKLHVENFDGGDHSFTAPELNLDAHIPAAKKEGVPSETVVSFTPKQDGTFHWQCDVPCDDEYNGWAMEHDGYMAGEVTVV